MPDSTVPTALDALKTALEARGGLSGVTVATAPLGSDTPTEALTFDDVDQTEERAATNITHETFDIAGEIYITKPGKGDTVATEARDRAYALLDELRNELFTNEDITGTVITSKLVSHELRQGVTDPPGRAANISFVVTVEASMTEQ